MPVRSRRRRYVPVRVAVASLVRGAGLAGDAIANHLRFRRGAARATSRAPASGAPRAAVPVFNTGRPATSASVLNNVSGFHFAIGYKHRVGARELYEIDRYAVAVRHRRLLDRLRLGRTQAACNLTGKSFQAQCRNRFETFPHRLRRQAEARFLPPDVRRFLDHLLDGQCALRMRVVDRGKEPIAHSSRRRLDDGVRTRCDRRPSRRDRELQREPGSKTSVNARLRIGRERQPCRAGSGCRSAGSRARGSRRVLT